MTRRLLAHTADLRAELVATDLGGLVAESTALVREILVGASPVEARERRRLELVGADDAERLFRLVRELLYLADTERFLPAAAVLDAGAVEITGELFDPDRHVAERQVKAVTRHRLALERTAGGLRLELVFDL